MAPTPDDESVDTDLVTVAALARLAAEISGLQRQVDQLHANLAESYERSRDLTDAKFVTYRTLIDSQADKVKLALEATEKAIDKAEIATSKAIEKESESNNDRFAKVNEFRAQQTELIGRFATLERVDLLSSNLGDRITELSLRIKDIEASSRGAVGNRNGIYAAIAAAVGLLAIVVFIANAITR